ncbi:adenylate/guanylate cyclase domain-containing protein [Planctobacterium marinum]|uniref:Guanylate cyclase n=1 Tax=Planctobacterium marinum TaxID=1631968 RepID=A0AA48HE79_9ALTE|nr:hypothetical protein MACH26_08690 [Planctobacterium marinum]
MKLAQRLKERIKSGLIMPVMLLCYATSPLLLLWLYFQFSWSGLGFLLLNCLFPAYAAWNSHKQHTETLAMQKSLILVLVSGFTLLTLSILDNVYHYADPVSITAFHLVMVYLLTMVLPKLRLELTGLEEGNQFPAFVFDDPDGNPITRKQLAKGPVLFYFFRGNWCPFCTTQIAMLMHHYKQIQDEGIHLAFVSTQPHEEMKKLAAKYDVECDYLVDVAFAFSSKYKLVHEGAVLPGLGRFGQDTLFPTLVLIDHSDKVLMLQRSDNFRLRPDPDQVLERIQRLGKNAWLDKLIKERTRQLCLEKEKSEQIILNILPEHTAIELKEKGKTEARFYECATLLFSDFVGFTRIASSVTPQILVDSLNAYFERYDRAIGELGLEKIKTIGDAYMVAGGLPVRDPQHAQKCAQFAFKMLEIGEQLKLENPTKGLCVFDIRIGIHSGPVMAGVVGERKFSYDIWGNTVNLAARMESASAAGRINISQATLDLLGDKAITEARGALEVKNHQPQQMYFLNGMN